MKTTINLNKIHNLPNGQVVNGFCESFASIDDARAAGLDYLEGRDRDEYACEIVRVCDDIDDDRYCEIVEVVESI